jgi:uncharacterized protein YcsI (UPF0317 family)
MTQSLHKITLAIAFVSLILGLSCKEDKVPIDLGVSVSYEGSLKNYNLEIPTFHTGDSIVFSFLYRGYTRPKFIDAKLVRIKEGVDITEAVEDSNSQTLIFTSFYPATINSINTVKWKIDEQIGVADAGQKDFIVIKSSNPTTFSDFIQYIRISNSEMK